jgi:hypothetical protein
VAGSLTLTAGALNGTGTLAAQGSLSQASTYGGGTATLLINGPGDQTFTGTATATAGRLPPLVIDKPSGTLSLVGTLRTTATPRGRSTRAARRSSSRAARFDRPE